MVVRVCVTPKIGALVLAGSMLSEKCRAILMIGYFARQTHSATLRSDANPVPAMRPLCSCCP